MRILQMCCVGIFLLSSSFAVANSSKEKNTSAMSNKQLDELIKRLDNKADGQPGFWTLTIENKILRVITE